MKFLFSIFILSLLISTGVFGQEKCSPNDIAVKQKQTGKLVEGKPEFEVTLFNECSCPAGNVKLDCYGFRTVEKIDPTVLLVTGRECHLPPGSFIAPFSGYVFSYAWVYEFQFKVKGATCV